MPVAARSLSFEFLRFINELKADDERKEAAIAPMRAIAAGSS
ncbi:hypothetical protein Y88_1580 [Novosphingobium nitrogenifigens DSM 19370]|uniref:Uncharacterized protein n=1 Tax=Novosphingobium nitrogenifigens DSM 19370 TaxID=983920 RepID=F1Z7N4_9SPHN|nr:hypothetical protein Y88_1580 [Novosphingobium nitrogenifigens DSM 19370]